MVKKLILFGVAAALGYVAASNLEVKKQLTKRLEYARAKVKEAIGNAEKASFAKEQEIRRELKVEN